MTLRFINSWGGSDPKADSLQTLFDEFSEANPDIAVSNESLFGEDFLVKLKSDFASGNDPDVFGLWPGSDIKKLVEAGKVADLTEVLETDSQWKRSFNPKMWYHTTFNDRIYGLPVELIFEGLFVNTDLFDRYQIKIPTNYEELKTAVLKFRENGITPIAFNCKAEGTYLYQNIAMLMGGKEAIENPIVNGTIHPCYLDAMERIRELYHLGAFPEDLFTMTSVERNDLFTQKKAAMIVQGSWFISGIPNEKTVELVPFPEMMTGGDNYSSMIYGLGCGTFYMSEKAWKDPERREASLKLLKHLTSRETATYLAEKTGMLSNVNISDYKILYSKLAREGINYTYGAKALIGPPDSYLPRTAWENVIVKNMPYMLEGEITPEDLWKRALNEEAP
ncbi:MAG: extracellular solute-binding protein [Clostridia bacterium]|nr:extracellular solute-binding protein [Clostridia bacterium]